MNESQPQDTATDGQSPDSASLQSTPWHCRKCGYEGRARTKLGSGLSKVDWAVVVGLTIIALSMLLTKQLWAFAAAPFLLVSAGSYFCMIQFRPARSYNICPQCRHQTLASKKGFTPMIPPSRRSKKRKHHRHSK